MTERSGAVQPVVAGLVSTLVGFSSTFAVVLAGLRAVGATAEQAASGLSALCLAIAVGSIGFALVTRRPVALAWSTPGAALLVTAGAPGGGFGAAVGAFVVTGLMLAVTGLVPRLGALVRLIPSAVANAMLAGVLLGLCVRPFVALPDDPIGIGAMLLAWIVLQRLAPRWAVPGALAAGLAVLVVGGPTSPIALPAPLPRLLPVAPVLDVQAVLGIAVPLYLVTMTAQNLPGAAVLRALGWEAPWRPALLATGGATALGALAGAHAVNLAAITATLTAGPDAGADRTRRWIAVLASGTGYLLLGALTPLVVAVASAAPPGLLAAFAGIALLGPLAGALARALEDERDRLAGAVALVVAASGVVLGGIGSAFWALTAGSAVVLLSRLRAPRRSGTEQTLPASPPARRP
ncbi:benzoate/H(+) symporter BenE family transporter [Amnibacterium endophyticum]|uniref:Benzoate/H(+) symporter BenE family transporter n=1 Tax=Amnibacterium endophyticum TaxID=2109337 RepID=A0ABW4LBM0_9MICO